MLDASPEVDRIRKLVSKRLMDSSRVEAGQRELDTMLITLWRAGYVTLEPEPPNADDDTQATETPQEAESPRLLPSLAPPGTTPTPQTPEKPPRYRPRLAHPTPELPKLLLLRGVNPLYGVFLVNQLGIADRAERIQAAESVLELPRSVGYYLRVPDHDELPPGPLATTRLDPHLLRLGLATAEELTPTEKTDEDRKHRLFEEERVWVLTLAEKLRRLFDYDFPNVHDVYTHPVWAAGELLQFGGDFNKYVTSRNLQKQEGIVFRHFLRLILLLKELTQLCPPETTQEEWNGDLEDIARTLTESCRRVDPTSTEKALEQAAADSPEDQANQ